MGYSTTFRGFCEFDKPLDDKLRKYLNDFASIRHMKRDNNKIMAMDPDWKDHGFNGNLGSQGEYYIPPKSMPVSAVDKNYPQFPPIKDDQEFVANFVGQLRDVSILDYNVPAPTVPGLWCQWIINSNDELVWDESEKFYYYIEWLNYLIKNFIAPSGYVLNGSFEWRGDEWDDTGEITVTDNVVTVKYGDEEEPEPPAKEISDEAVLRAFQMHCLDKAANASMQRIRLGKEMVPNACCGCPFYEDVLDDDVTLYSFSEKGNLQQNNLDKLPHCFEAYKRYLTN